ncbi:IS30 family transposase [Asaccharospora irregularis]|uniref:Transposase and inactivated derivatives, IS30 family n=1 Tax=Asaccharospora irregularis DSM 2635 TaxID=1121321 RepID=A0A1M5T959_9FIRM|nr:IS30 family transposase [Asaccharospora irregularis]SHH47226.1 Transposase and inactivated derivatives, IS30 family [Asaccharospora irregularis DSM 2635]
MDNNNNNISIRKNKHLNFKERTTIEIRVNDGMSAYKIAKELGRPINTIINEIKRGTVKQIKQNRSVEMYLADAGQAIYEKNRRSSVRPFKRLSCGEFISYAVDKIKNNKLSPDACFGEALRESKFARSDMVCTKTLYNYIDLGLLEVKNVDLSFKLRRNTKPSRVRKNKRILGSSISERPNEIDSREEFGHWEIDTVIGEKSNSDDVLLTIVERKTRNAIIRKIESKTATAVSNELLEIRNLFGEKFDEVFKSITGDNGSEFAELANIEEVCNTKVYFTHPYSSFERGTNERHNGLVRRFIPKGKRISNYDINDIGFIEEWMNTLPRKILGYNTPEKLFEEHLDSIYAA